MGESMLTFETLVTLASQLSRAERARLIERVAASLAQESEGQFVESSQTQQPLRSLLGLWADLGPAPSAEEIDEARREMWGNFPREDI